VGAALVIRTAPKLLTLVQAFRVLALFSADACWLLLTPLERLDVLRQPHFLIDSRPSCIRQCYFPQLGAGDGVAVF